MKNINKDRLKFLYERAKYENRLSPDNVVLVRAADLLAMIHELKARRRQCSRPKNGGVSNEKE